MKETKYYAIGALCTLAIAVPAAVIALATTAMLDLYLPEIGRSLTDAAATGWRELVSGFSGRLPEAAGMLIGQLLLMAVLLVGGSKALQRGVQAG